MSDIAYSALRHKLAGHVTVLANERGLVSEQRRGGREVVQADGRRVPLCERCLWPVRDDTDVIGHRVDVEYDEAKILAMATTMVERIHAEHGPGRVLHLGDGLVHIVNDDGCWLRCDDYADRMIVRLRSLHNHESDAR